MKKFFIYLSIVVLAVSCDDDAIAPDIRFDGDETTHVFAGDVITVTGKISAGNSISDAYWFHQKLDENGNLDEQTGGLLELGTDGAFSVSVEVERTTIGVKIITEDSDGNRKVSVFPIVLGEDALTIAFEGNGFIEEINSGETFNIKGTVNSGTPITSITYTVIRGEITENPVQLTLDGTSAYALDIPVVARNRMTGIRIDAANRGSLKDSKLFEIRNVVPSETAVLFDKDEISVKPDSVFNITGRVATNQGRNIVSISYVVIKEDGTDPQQTTELLSDNRFEISLTASDRITHVIVTAKDSNGDEGDNIMPVTVLYPSRTEGSVIVHYKYLIFDDSRSFGKSYFSFDVAPYVLNAEQAKANQSKITMMYTNVFISDGHANNGAALFGANAYWATTVLAQALTEGWTLSQNETQLARLPVRTDMSAAAFDALGDTQEEWDAIDTWGKGVSSSNSVLRSGTAASTVRVGSVFLIKYGGINSAGNTGITKHAVGIVRGKGGTPATSANQSTGSWLEIEIKARK